MNKAISTMAATAALVAGQLLLPFGGAAPASAASWTVAGGDEFNGASVDSAKWRTYDPSWGTGLYGESDPNTLHCLTKNNVSVGGGAAVIKAKKQTVNCGGKSRQYTSGFLTSGEAGKYYPLYGRFEIRARIPHAQGIWPAFWLRHVNGASVAEIDIVEVFHSSGPGSNVNTLHFPNSIGKNVAKIGKQFETPVKGSGGWHTFAVDIEQVYPGRDDAVRFTFWQDGAKTLTYTNTRAGAFTSVKDKSRVWNIAINTAVGGTYVGNPDQKLGWFPAMTGACSLERGQRKTSDAASCGKERSQGKWYNNDIPSAPAPNKVPDIWLAPWNYTSGATSDYHIDYFRYYKKA